MTLSAKQLEKRRFSVGGSDVPAIFGVSPYSTAVDVWLEKTGKDVSNTDGNRYTEFGNAVEGVIISYYEREKNVKVELPEDDKMYYHPSYPFMHGNFDGMAGDVIVEAKTATYMKEWDNVEGDLKIPVAYQLQAMHYMAVFDKSFVDFAVMFTAHRQFDIRRMERDLSKEKKMIAFLVKFWEEHVLKDVPPPPQEISDFRIYQDTGEIAVADASVENALKELATVKEEIKANKEHEKSLKIRVFDAMRNASTLVGDGGEVLATWNKQTKNFIDQKRLKKEQPEICAAYNTATVSRVLRIKGSKK